ncbi:MAG: hypothetical protein ACRDQ7_24875 [Haloechinothrix sp.]
MLETVALLRAGAVAAIGTLLDSSHDSLHFDYRVSCRELDEAVDCARAAGAEGARMTGGGFRRLGEAGARREFSTRYRRPAPGGTTSAQEGHRDPDG